MHVCMDVNRVWMTYVHNLGCFAARFMWSYSLGNQTQRTSAYVTLINSAILYIKINVFEKIQLSIDACVCVCMHVRMDIWMWAEFWMKYVHNLGCFAARFMWSYSLGNQTLRTSAYVTLINKLRYTVYQKNVFQKIQLSIRVCVYTCMYVWM